MTTPLHYRNLADVAEDVRFGRLSAEEVTRHTLARIASLDPKLHAFAHVRADDALREARALDARRGRGEPLGPLAGVPIAVKDLSAMAGTPTRAGGLFSTFFKADETATSVKRLQDAGAIIIGKAQLTEGAWGTHHPSVPTPINPWVADRWAGASSSGSGVSVAAGLAFGATGTDTAGSIRFPSSCNHLVGLKPTWGRVSRHGIFPLSDTLDHVGPMARSVRDVALMYAALAGEDPLDPTTRIEPVDDPVAAVANGTLKGVKIGLDPAYTLNSIDPSVAAMLNATIEVLTAHGATVVHVQVPEVDSMLPGAVRLAATEATVSHARTYPSEKAKYGKAYANVLELGLATTSAEYAQVAIWRRAFAGGLTRIFNDVDMIIAPVLPILPFTVSEMDTVGDAPPIAAAGLMRFTLPFNLAGVPSLTLPMARTSEGMPLGFQIIGPELSEAKLLSAGAAYEAATKFDEQHPVL